MKKVIVTILLVGSVVVSTTASAACRLPVIQKSFTTESERQAYKAKVDKAQRCHQEIISKNEAKIKELNTEISKLEKENSRAAKDWNDFISKF